MKSSNYVLQLKSKKRAKYEFLLSRKKRIEDTLNKFNHSLPDLTELVSEGWIGPLVNLERKLVFWVFDEKSSEGCIAPSGEEYQFNNFSLFDKTLATWRQRRVIVGSTHFSG